MERWLSWSKAHDWKSCVRLITDRGFESLSLRHEWPKPNAIVIWFGLLFQNGFFTVFAICNNKERENAK